MNHASLSETIGGAREIGFDWISFLGADASSQAFNRPTPWDAERVDEIVLGPADLAPFAASIERALRERAADVSDGFVVGGAASLWRLHRYYGALCGEGALPEILCNAPWVSAVVDVDQAVRPCFFHPPYGSLRSASLESVLNSEQAIDFRRRLDVNRNATCMRCVCTLQLPLTGRA